MNDTTETVVDSLLQAKEVEALLECVKGMNCPEHLHGPLDSAKGKLETLAEALLTPDEADVLNITLDAGEKALCGHGSDDFRLVFKAARAKVHARSARRESEAA